MIGKVFGKTKLADSIQRSLRKRRSEYERKSYKFEKSQNKKRSKLRHGRQGMVQSDFKPLRKSTIMRGGTFKLNKPKLQKSIFATVKSSSSVRKKAAEKQTKQTSREPSDLQDRSSISTREKRVRFNLHKTDHKIRKREDVAVKLNLDEYPPEVRETFTIQQIIALKKLFMENKDGSDWMTNTKVDLLARSYGYNPTEAFLLECFDKLDNLGRGRLKEKEFIMLMADLERTATTDAEVIAAFRVFDPNNTGMIKVADIVQVLTTQGEIFDKAELNLFIKQADLGGLGTIEYVDLVNRMNLVSNMKTNIESRRAAAKKLKKAFREQGKLRKRLARKLLMAAKRARKKKGLNAKDVSLSSIVTHPNLNISNFSSKYDSIA